MSPKTDCKPTTVPAPDDLPRLMARVQQGDQSALPPLRAYLQREGVWQKLGDLARYAEEALLDRVAPTQVQEAAPDLPAPRGKENNANNVLGRQAIAEQLALLRAELVGDDATPLERVL